MEFVSLSMLSKLERPPAKYFWFFVGGLLLYTLPGYILSKKFPGFEDSIPYDLLSDLALLAAVYPVARFTGFRFRDIGSYLTGLKTLVRPAFLYFLLAIPVLEVLDYVYMAALAPWDLPLTNKLLFWNSGSSNPVVSDVMLSSVIDNPFLLPAYIAGICITAPLIEEFLLRRWLYVSMRARLAAPAAILLNGAFFGLMHGKDFMGTALHGVVFCWVYERTGKLGVPILVHAFGNLLALSLLFGDKLFW